MNYILISLYNGVSSFKGNLSSRQILLTNVIFKNFKVGESLIIYSNCFLMVLFFLQLGGTIGDIEGMPFVEAFRQFQFRVKRENFACVHVSLIPQVIYFSTFIYFFLFIFSTDIIVKYTVID